MPRKTETPAEPVAKPVPLSRPHLSGGRQPAVLQQVVDFQVTTWNVMGLTAVTEDMQHLLQHSRETKKVRVHVFTETKLVPKQHHKKWLQNIFHEWNVHYSSKASGTQVKQHYHRQGSAGIIIACPKACEFGCFERLQDVPVHLSGHLLIMKNSTASIIIAGVYMPCEDTELRKGIYE